MIAAATPRLPGAVLSLLIAIMGAMVRTGAAEAADATPQTLYGATDTMVLQNFDGSSLPVDGDGDTYPNQYAGAGTATVTEDGSDAVSGSSVRFDVTAGAFYAEFDPYNYAATPGFPPAQRAFAHDYCLDPAHWKYNTYNRLMFWIQRPASATPLNLGGDFYDFQVGTYVKQIINPDPTSDEFGGDHYYHNVGLPNIGGGVWTQVILNMHPDHRRSIAVDPGVSAYPTSPSGPNGGTDPDGTYNYFDTMTRIYFSDAPTLDTYRIDDLTFFAEPYPENDEQVFSLTATYVIASNRLLVTWKKDWADTCNYDVAYAFSDIHALGWANATPAPAGIITPPNSPGGYNGMYYDTTQLPLSGHAVVYIAIKPENSTVFSQIAVPLGSLGGSSTGGTTGSGSGTTGTTATTSTSATGTTSTTSTSANGAGTGDPVVPTGGGSSGSSCGLGGATAGLVGLLICLTRRRPSRPNSARLSGRAEPMRRRGD